MRTLLLWIRICCLSSLLIIALPAQTQDTTTDIYLEIECVCTAEWNFDGTKLAVVAQGSIQIWDTNRWEIAVTIADATDFTAVIAWHPYENLIAGVGGWDAEAIYVWDATTGEQIHHFARPRQPGAGVVVMHAIAWSHDGNRIVTDSDGVDTLLMWDLNADDNPQVFVPRRTLHHNAFGLAWSPDGRYIVSGGADDRLPMGTRRTSHIWDGATGRLLRTFAGRDPFDWSPDGSQFVSVTLDNVITIRDIETFEIVASTEGHPAGVYFISWNFAENFIASANVDGDVIIWDIETDTSFTVDGLPFTTLMSVDWHPHSTLLAIAGRGGVVIRNIVRPE